MVAPTSSPPTWQFHDPGGARVPTEDIVLRDIVVQGQELHGFEHDAAMAMHDRLRHTGRARGVDDPKGVIERHRLDVERHIACHELREVMRLRKARAIKRARRAGTITTCHSVGSFAAIARTVSERSTVLPL